MGDAFSVPFILSWLGLRLGLGVYELGYKSFLLGLGVLLFINYF